MIEPTPIALESAANQAYGKALHDVAAKAQAYREVFFTSLDDGEVTAVLTELTEALDRLTALGWVLGPERVGMAPGSLPDAEADDQ